jgi:hypothetical protein
MENNPKRNTYYMFCHIIFFLSSESIVEELEIYTSSIKDMGEVCEKLGDVQSFLFCHNKSELL